MTTKQRPAVVIYAALSRKKAKKDDDDRADEESVESQVAKVRTRLQQRYGDDVDVLGVFSEVGHSGSKRNRGPELERAIAAVTSAAAERDVVELWANTSARFARGTGKRNEARAVGELFYDLRRRGVALRTVEDDEFVTNEMLVGFASAQASKYAKDLAESVTRAKRRQAERGEHLGGPLPIGYLKGSNPPAVDAAHRGTVERIMELADQGVPDSALARTVNAEGYRTRAGRPFDRRAIQAIVCNPFYAGLVVYDGEEFEGKHPSLVDRERWRRITKARAKRDRGAGRHQAGRPAKRHLLSSLAVCADCGAPMYAQTSSYKRKSDGGRSRTYACRSYRFSDGVCDAKPVDAEAVDIAVMERLHDLLPDFERWIAQIEDRHADERARLAQLVDRAEADLDEMQSAAQAHEKRYRAAVAGGDDAKADLLLDFVQDARRDVEAAETRLTATRDALASVPDEAPRDRLLDFALGLRAAISGKAANAHSAEEVNRVLLESFDSFAISVGDWLPPDVGVHVGDVKIEPNLRPEIIDVLVAEHWPEKIQWPAPPMVWIEALSESRNEAATPERISDLSQS